MTAVDRTLHAIDATLTATEAAMTSDRIPAPRVDPAGLPTVERLRRQRDDLAAELNQVRDVLTRADIQPTDTTSTPDLVEQLVRQRNDARLVAAARHAATGGLDAQLAGLRADLARAHADLGAAQELIAVYDDVAEQLDRARARYATRPEPAAPRLGSAEPPAHDSIEILLANVTRSLTNATDDDERAEAVEMLLDGWYAAWPDSAVTSPSTPLSGELVRLLRPPAQDDDEPFRDTVCQNRAPHDDLTDRLAAALADVVRRCDVSGHRAQTARHTGWIDIITIHGWRLLLAQHAERKG